MVLIMMLLGGLVIGPLLAYMNAGLKAGRLHEEKTQGYYAADAGIEDAIWKLKFIGLLFAGDSYPLLGEPVNEMDVTVVILNVEDLVDEDGLLYTIQSTATQDTEDKGEIVAEVKVLPTEDAASGGVGGDFHATENKLISLSIIDPNTIIFSTYSANEVFRGAADFDEHGEEIWYGPIKPNGLFWLDIAYNKAGIYLDNDDYIDHNDRINSLHYKECTGYNCTLISIDSYSEVGVPPVDVDVNDIFELNLDNGGVSDVVDMGADIGENTIVASYGRLDCGYAAFNCTDTLYPGTNILFSVDPQHNGSGFEPWHVIGYDEDESQLKAYLDVCDILSCPPQELGITALAPLADGRLLLSFDVAVTESDPGDDGELNEIKKTDIAIWTPHEWQCEEDEDGECIKDDDDNIVVANCGNPYNPESEDNGTITLHIDMHGPDAQLVGSPPDISILSWNI